MNDNEKAINDYIDEKTAKQREKGGDRNRPKIKNNIQKKKTQER